MNDATSSRSEPTPCSGKLSQGASNGSRHLGRFLLPDQPAPDGCRQRGPSRRTVTDTPSGRRARLVSGPRPRRSESIMRGRKQRSMRSAAWRSRSRGRSPTLSRLSGPWRVGNSDSCPGAAVVPTTSVKWLREYRSEPQQGMRIAASRAENDRVENTLNAYQDWQLQGVHRTTSVIGPLLTPGSRTSAGTYRGYSAWSPSHS